MKNLIKYLLLALIAGFQVIACGSDGKEGPANDFDIRFAVPASADIPEGGDYTFAVQGEGGGNLR